MIKAIAVFTFIYISSQQLVPISVSSPGSTFSEPGHFPTVPINWDLKMGDLLLGANYSSKWIMTTDWKFPTKVNFHTIFRSSCENPATLKITAWGSFKARFNGGELMTGYGENHIFVFPLNDIRCGENTLVVTV